MTGQIGGPILSCFWIGGVIVAATTAGTTLWEYLTRTADLGYVAR